MEPTRPSSLPTGSSTTPQPTSGPSRQPVTDPTSKPSHQPTSVPSTQPYAEPSYQPSTGPSAQPTMQPTNLPRLSPRPTALPSNHLLSLPSLTPSNQPSTLQTILPTLVPSSQQSLVSPSSHPTQQSSTLPSCSPTSVPSKQPISIPSSQPSVLSFGLPTSLSTNQPTEIPTGQHTFSPYSGSTVCPSSKPNVIHTNQPTSQPSSNPSHQPNAIPSTHPSTYPTYPTSHPSFSPRVQPVSKPTCSPSFQPSTKPSAQPSQQPYSQPTTSSPSKIPFGLPTSQPTSHPTSQPLTLPTFRPTHLRIPPSILIPTIIITEHPTPIPILPFSASPIYDPSPHPTPLKSTENPSYRPSFRPGASAATRPISVFPSGNMNFKISLFIFGAYLPAVENIPNIYLTEDNIGSSYIIFGFKEKERRPREIVIGTRNSQGFYSTIPNKAGGLIQDQTMSRAALPLGDFNGDLYEDLLICDPLNSRCFVYFDDMTGQQSLQVSITIKSDKNDLFGWSTAKLNDANSPVHERIAISALSSNVIYLFFRANLNTAEISIDQFDASVGIRIIGSQFDQNSGLALSSAGDFSNDGFSDILFSAIQINPYQNVIYVLFFSPNIMKLDIVIDDLIANKHYFKIIAPLFSFAGFSLCNLGDINQDGFDDIVIGSIPYSGKYLTQKSYVIYGRNSSTTLSLSQMNEEDGFIISGGGFMVGGPGDVTGDGVPDIMISSYQLWQGKGNCYIMVYPRNITSPPTFLPSSQPSALPSSSPTAPPSINSTKETTNQPSHYGTFPPNLPRTEKPSLAPKDSKPSRIPSMKPSTRFPTVKTNLPSVSPSRKPTVNPTRTPTTTMPTRIPNHENFPSMYPSSNPSVTPTVSVSTPPQEITIDSEGVYDVPSGKSDLIISGEGSFEITNSGGGRDKKIYTILPSKNIITIANFNKEYDQINLIHFPYLYSINDLVYRTNPLQIFLSSEQKLILPAITASELTEENFIFQKEKEKQRKKTNFQLDLSAVISLGILFGCVGIFGCFTKLNEDDKDHSHTDSDIGKEISGELRPRKIVDGIKHNSGNELNEKVSSVFSSLQLSSSESAEFSITDSSVQNEEARDHYDKENDSNLLSSLKSFFSSNDDGSPAKEVEEGDESLDGSSIDIEGNYQEPVGEDMEEDIYFIQRLFNHSR
jgi:hypothetical protein